IWTGSSTLSTISSNDHNAILKNACALTITTISHDTIRPNEADASLTYFELQSVTRNNINDSVANKRSSTPTGTTATIAHFMACASTGSSTDGPRYHYLIHTAINGQCCCCII